jgi:pimeloyl-ACP methyl ester carboxylesterase
VFLEFNKTLTIKKERGKFNDNLPTTIRPPLGYQGDFYVDGFTDAKIKQAWQELKAKDPEAAKKILDGLKVGKKSEYRFIGVLDLNGVVNGNDDLKLTDIRRPAFFGQAPYYEDIAKVEQDTYTVEFTVPRDLYEQSILRLTDPIKLRGWFIKGKGIPNANGKRTHALIIYHSGATGQLGAIEHPNAPQITFDSNIKQYISVSFPNKDFQTENKMRNNRQILYELNKAGFDVLAVDKRGNGYSGGVYNQADNEMAEDIFRMLDQLELGSGLTVLTSTGKLLQEKETAGLLLRGMPAKQVPVLISGCSQGAIIAGYVMQKNFVGWTDAVESGSKIQPAKKYNIKAAILLDGIPGGVGYRYNGWADVYKEAARRDEMYVHYLPTSEILANIDKWPAVYFEQGLWDNAQCPEGTYDAYRRAKGLKELVFWGPHSGSSCHSINEHLTAYMIKMKIEFAVRSLVNPGKKYTELKSFKEAVLNSAPYWDSTSRP